MVDGCRIRELPDGGREFVLDQTALSFIRIDDQSRLRFGLTEVAIATPFVLATGGVVHHLSPQHSEGLGPLVALYPGSVRWMWTSPGGELRVVFQSGAVLTVSPDPVDTAWSVGNVYAQTGGAGPLPPAA